MDARAGGGGGDRPWILVLDVGSSSVRTRLFDPEGHGRVPGPGCQLRYRWSISAAGAMECDPAALVERVERVIDAALAGARQLRGEIAAVAVTTLWHSLLGVDKQGVPLTPLYGWGDSRAAGVAAQLREEVDAEAAHRRTGCFLHPSYPSMRLAWLRRRDPERFARVSGWISIGELLEQRFFGTRRCSLSMASGTGLMDVHRLEWDPQMLDVAGIDERRLSPLVDGAVALRGLRRPYAERWPELAAVDWFPALGDGACASVGSGAAGADVLALTVGTTAAARVLWEPAGPVAVPADLWCYRLDARRWVAGGAMSNGGNAVASLRRLLALPAVGDWEAALAAMEPDSHGLTVLPSLVGERAPGRHGESSASVVGLTQASTPEQLLRAWMEAIAYRIADICERLDAAFGPLAQVRASGGALHASLLWTQMLADVLDRTVVRSAERETTSRGAAVIALERLSWIPTLADASPTEEVHFRPDPARHARYRVAMERQRALAGALAPWLAATPPPHPGAEGDLI